MSKLRKTSVAIQQPEKRKETPLQFSASMSTVLVVGLFVLTFNVQAFEIPSGSMENTILIGDHLFVDRISYAPQTKWFPGIPYRQLERGDIFVFLHPAEPGTYVVKRVIGLPGDRIRLNGDAAGLRDATVYVNGIAQDEPYVIHKLGNYDSYRDDFPLTPSRDGDAVTPEWRLRLPSHIEKGEIVVPPDCYFAMGDNRDDSADSRYWGFVPRENVIGRPLFIYWSFETPPDQYKKTGLRDRLAFATRVGIHFFDETRWRRMFKQVR